MLNFDILKFIIIDDDGINNFLVKGVLKQLAPSAEVISFTDPELAVEHLLHLETVQFKNLSIFLDLNMPILNGWDVLDKLSERFEDKLPENACIFIASSSNIEQDMSRAKNYGMVNAYLTKPLKLENIKEALRTNIRKN
jgi:CheY-like chemotaxis protein